MPQNPSKPGAWRWFQEQFATLPLVGKYYIPEETNNIWYSLGGMLFVALVLQICDGVLMTVKYVPDASLAYGIVADMIHSSFWRVVLGFHYYNSFVIFGLVGLHMMRVFVSAAYRGGKKGLWLVGVALAVLLFAIYLTGEALHWDEVGFAVPWNISEILQAVGLSNVFHYNFSDLLAIPSATVKLAQLYALHVAVLPLLILALVALHFYLIRMKGISLPFWKRHTGAKAPFATHIKGWIVYGSFIFGAVLLVSIVFTRSVGTAPQLLPSSPIYQTDDDAGGLGFKPTFPVSWTRGWNIFVADRGVDPDIWGTVLAMVIMLGALVAIPFVDRGASEPTSGKNVFDWEHRKWAYLIMAIFWIVLLIGFIQGAISGTG